MRRPTQHHPLRTAAHGAWAHPYAGVGALAVFHADGGDDPAQPPAPTPPKPGPPPSTPPAGSFTQDDLERIAAKEKAQGERAGARKALEEFAAEHGFTNVDDAKAFIAEARKAKQDALSEEEKRRQELEEDRRKLDQEKAQMAEAQRALVRERTLGRLGAVDSDDAPNLQDALAMLDRDLRNQPDADEQAVSEAAAKLKERRPELFGAKPPAAPSTLPPAPGGAPAGGTPGRQTPSKDDAKARARKLAEKMGYARPDAA